MAPKRSASSSPSNSRSPKVSRKIEDPTTSIEEIQNRIKDLDASLKELEYQIFLERNIHLKEIDEGVGRKYFEIMFKAEPFVLKAWDRLTGYYGEDLQGHHTWDDYNPLNSHGRFDGVPEKMAIEYWKEHFPEVDFKETLGISTIKSTKYRKALRDGEFDCSSDQ